MSDAAKDRLIIAEISGVTSRHMPLSGYYPQGEAHPIPQPDAVGKG